MLSIETVKNMEKIFKKEVYSEPAPTDPEYQGRSRAIGKSEFENSKDYVIKKHINLFKKLAK